MRIALLNPPDTNQLVSNIPAVFKKDRGRIPPLGLMYLAGCLKPSHSVSIIDASVENLDYRGVARRIADINPDVIGITVTTFSLMDVKLSVRAIKKTRAKRATIVMGGPHPTIYPDETLSALEADYAVVGEAELLINDLMKSIGNGNSHSPRIWRQHDYIEDLDRIPFPARELTQIDRYWNVMSEGNPVTTGFTSRGCPFNCAFCYRPTHGRKFRAMSYNRVVDEMEECEYLGIKEIMYYDDTFTVSKERVHRICDEIFMRAVKLKWDIRARVDTVDYDLIKHMKESGCERIHFGIESGSPRVLRAMNKRILPDQVRLAFKWCHELGMTTLGCFMIGNPCERKSDIEMSKALAKEVKPDYIVVGAFTPYPETKLYQDAIDKKMLSDVWKRYAKTVDSDFKAPLWLEHFTKDQLLQELRAFYKSFYVTPNYVWQRLKDVKNLTQLWRYIKAGVNMLWVSTTQNLRR